MGKYPRFRGRPVNQYSYTYHLSRKVPCVDCGVELHKNHDFVLHGSRCSHCWNVYVVYCNSLRAYTVYVWSESTVVEADIVQEVFAVSVDGAIEQVMISSCYAYASYVWVVSADEGVDTE